MRQKFDYRLDKLSVLRLAVSFLQIKAHFQVCSHRSPYIANFPYAFTHTYPFFQGITSNQYESIPSFVHATTGHTYIDPNERDFASVALKALGGFLLILNENGEIYYASENIETYLGFHQSDILHQSLYEMIHSEDREDIKNQLSWNYNVPTHVTCLQDLLTPGGIHHLDRNVNARFRCLLDNTCGFLRIDVRGKLMSLHGLPNSYAISRSEVHSSPSDTVFGLIAICSPFVPPNIIDEPFEDAILKTKHSIDMTLISSDNRMRSVLELSEKNLPHSFYSLVHIEDAACLAEAHKEVLKSSASGLLIYRLISIETRMTYWIQSSCRMFYKNGKAESIGMTHRILTEVEGIILLDKRASLKTKLLSFDDSLLQSPRNLQSTAALPSTSTVFTKPGSRICTSIPTPYYQSNEGFRPLQTTKSAISSHQSGANRRRSKRADGQESCQQSNRTNRQKRNSIHYQATAMVANRGTELYHTANIPSSAAGASASISNIIPQISSITNLSTYLPSETITMAQIHHEPINPWPSSNLCYQNYPNTNPGYNHAFPNVLSARQFDDTVFIQGRVDCSAVFPPQINICAPTNQLLCQSAVQNEVIAPTEFIHCYPSANNVKSTYITPADIAVDYPCTDYKTLLQLTNECSPNLLSMANATSQLTSFNFISEMTNSLMS